jgi:hypothetical protein
MKRLRSKIYRYIVAFSFAVATINSFAQTVICRKQKIGGFESEYNVGHAICSDNTSEIEKTKIYITVQGESIYLQSNFVTPPFDNPTKIATAEVLPLGTYVQNIIYSGDISPSTYEALMRKIENHAEFYLDPKIINSKKFADLDFYSIKNLNIVTSDNKVRKAIKLFNDDGTKELLVEINETVSARIKGQNLDNVFAKLHTQKMSGKNIKIISLVENSPTKQYLKDHFNGRTIEFDYSSVDELKKKILENRNSPIAILGHIEHGAFVVVNSSGKQLFKVEVAQLETWQKENNIRILFLGCSSAKNGAVSGTLDVINPIETLERLRTTEHTENTGEFLDSLTLRTMHYVVDEAMFSNIATDANNDISSNGADIIKIKIYKKPHSSAIRSKEVGQIYFYGLNFPEIENAVAVPINDSTQEASSDTSKVSPQKPSDSSLGNNLALPDNTIFSRKYVIPVLVIIFIALLIFLYFKKINHG